MTKTKKKTKKGQIAKTSRLTEGEREFLATSLVLYLDYCRVPGKINMRLHDKVAVMAQRLGITAEYGRMLASMPPMDMQPRKRTM